MSPKSMLVTEHNGSWAAICADPFLAQLPYRIETHRWGHLVMSPPPRSHHAEYQGEIIRHFCLLLPHGRSMPECPLRTSEGVKAIDVAWVSDARRKSRPNDPCYLIAPEICVEVESPSNTQAELMERKRLCFEKGALEVWLCDQEGCLAFFDPAGSLDQSKLCPEFPRKLALD